MNYTYRGRVFSFTEEDILVEKNIKNDLVNIEKATLKDQNNVEASTTNSIREQEPEQVVEPTVEQSHSTPSQKESIVIESSPSPPLKQSSIESTSSQPELSISSTPILTTTTLSSTTIITSTLSPQENQHPHPKRNYASKECGAKVLYSNEEAENRGAILNDPERDDYMRNPCERAQNKFLIIELCETIQLNSFEIANFELFSSNPKNFRLWGSERYPTQEWILIGDFEAQNIRQLQSFDVKEETNLYVKFVKLDLLTHYGNEHFCTLSTFVIYGTSIVDEYEAEAASTTLQQQQQFNNIGGDNLKEEEVFKKKDHDELKNNKNVTINETDCNKVMDENHQKIIKNDDNDPNVSIKNISNNTEEENNNILNNKTINEDNNELLKTGNMLKTIVEQLGSNIKNVIGQAFSKGNNKDGGNVKGDDKLKKHILRFTFSSCQQCSNFKHLLTTTTCNYLSIFCWTFFPNIYRILKHKQQYLFDSTKKINGAHKFQNYFLDKVLRRQISSFCPLPSLPLTCNRKSETNVDETLQKQQHQTSSKHLNKNNVTSSSSEQQTKQQNNNIVVENVENIVVIKTQRQQKQPVTPTYVLDEKVSRPLPGTSTNSKESIFMKLNKRLVLLEQNMSTSNEHLNELSKRVGIQDEEFTLKHEKIARTTAENVAKHETQIVKDEMGKKITELQQEVKRLSQQLQTVTTSMQPSSIKTKGRGGPTGKPINGYYQPLPQFYINNNNNNNDNKEEQNHCNGKTCISSYIPPTTHYSQISGFINGRVDEGYTRQEGLWTTNEVIILVILCQICTLIALKIIHSLINCLKR